MCALDRNGLGNFGSRKITGNGDNDHAVDVLRGGFGSLDRNRKPDALLVFGTRTLPENEVLALVGIRFFLAAVQFEVKDISGDLQLELAAAAARTVLPS